MKMPPLLADFTHARPCKPFCEKYLTLPDCGKQTFQRGLAVRLATEEEIADYIRIQKELEKENEGG